MAVTTPPAAAPALAAQLARYRRRVQRDRRRRAAAWGLAAAAAGWLIVALLYALDGPWQAAAWLALAATLLLPLGAALLVTLRPPPPARIAALVDRGLDDRQRLATAVELAATPRPAPLVEEQLASTAALLGRAEPRRVYPGRAPWPAGWLALSALCLAVAVALLRGALDPPATFQAAPRPSGAQPAVVTPTAIPPRDATQVAQQADQSQQAQTALERLARALSEQSVTQRAADSLRQGNYPQAAQQITDVGERNDQISDAAKRALGESLSRAAADSAAAPALEQAEEAAASALAGGEFHAVQAAMKGLAAAVLAEAQQIVQQQDLAPGVASPTPPGLDGTPAAGEGGSPTPGGTPAPGDAAGAATAEPSAGPGATPSPNGGADGSADAGSTPGAQPATPNPADTPGPGEPRPGLTPSDHPPEPGRTPDTTEGSNTQGGGNGATRVTTPETGGPDDIGVDPFQLQGSEAPGQTRPGAEGSEPGLAMAGAPGAAAPAPAAGAPVAQPDEPNQPPVENWDLIRRYFSHADH
jgi:hypothetical protein